MLRKSCTGCRIELDAAGQCSACMIMVCVECGVQREKSDSLLADDYCTTCGAKLSEMLEVKIDKRSSIAYTDSSEETEKVEEKTSFLGEGSRRDSLNDCSCCKQANKKGQPEFFCDWSILFNYGCQKRICRNCLYHQKPSVCIGSILDLKHCCLHCKNRYDQIQFIKNVLIIIFFGILLVGLTCLLFWCRLNILRISTDYQSKPDQST